jgi:hypothetical protein
MELMTRQPGLAQFPEPMFDWEPDADRLEREVRNAELKGRRDDLTLAEIECSIDLLDAELVALRSHPQPDLSPDKALRQRTAVRGRLLGLATRLQRLPG